MSKTMEEIIGQAIGEASMLWSETPTGVFESTKASELIDRTVALLKDTRVEGKGWSVEKVLYFLYDRTSFGGKNYELRPERLAELLCQYFKAPEKIRLPEKKRMSFDDNINKENEIWNSAIDKCARMNGVKK